MDINEVVALARKEAAAETSRTKADAVWRAAWWDTTLALGSIPQEEKKLVGEAQSAVRTITGNTPDWVKRRTRAGRAFGALKGTQRLMPRMAIEAAESGAAINAEMVEKIIKAEADGQSIREFRLALTGKSWTSTPENLTEAEKIEITEKVLRYQPHAISSSVMAQTVEKVMTDPNVVAKVDTETLAHQALKANDAKYQQAVQEQWESIKDTPIAQELGLEEYKQKINGTHVRSRVVNALQSLQIARLRSHTVAPPLDENQRRMVLEVLFKLVEEAQAFEAELSMVIPDDISELGAS